MRASVIWFLYFYFPFTFPNAFFSVNKGGHKRTTKLNTYRLYSCFVLKVLILMSFYIGSLDNIHQFANLIFFKILLTKSCPQILLYLRWLLDACVRTSSLILVKDCCKIALLTKFMVVNTWKYTSKCLESVILTFNLHWIAY